jgi:hypothetical protein
LISFLGFIIPFAVLPFIIGYGLIRIGTQIISRMAEVNMESKS